MRYFVRFSYLGTEFHGSQVQPNGVSVQEVMEDAFATILRQPVALCFAGRTDAGVHAAEMYAHFDLEIKLPNNLAGRLNNLLPQSVAVSDIFAVPDTLHARFSATARTYKYHITMVKNPFAHGRAARVAAGLDFEAMNRAAQLLKGTHDFASFCRSHHDAKTTFCTVTRAEWQVEDNGDSAVFTITANRFLRNMVRAVVGTLLEVGRGKLGVAEFQQIIDAHNRSAAGMSAPAKGLFLTHISYPDGLGVTV